MIVTYFPERSLTMVERYTKQNTSKDEILELEKIINSPEVSGTYNTRFILDFQLRTIYDKAEIEFGNLRPEATTLELFVANAELTREPFKATIDAVGEDWVGGIGKSTHNPRTEEGAGWKFRDTDNNLTWTNGAGSPARFAQSASFTVNDKDVRVDITDLADRFHTGPVSQDRGVVIFHNSETGSAAIGSVKYFSGETSTVYKPKVKFKRDDSSYVSGSVTLFDLNDDQPQVTFTRKSLDRLEIGTKQNYFFELTKRFPTKVYATQSGTEQTKYRFPETTYYGIKDVATGEMVQDFDTSYTKVSFASNTKQHYFSLHTSGLYHNRLYQVIVRVIHKGHFEEFDGPIFRAYE